MFGPDDVERILGATALESVGITIDPTTCTLKTSVILSREDGEGSQDA